MFRLCVLAYRCLHNSAPSYLSVCVEPVGNNPGRRQLRSASSGELVVPLTRRTTLGDRAFKVAAARAWNDLPVNIRTAPSVNSFRQFLKTYFFRSTFG